MFPVEIVFLSRVGSIKSEMGTGSMGQVVGVLTQPYSMQKSNTNVFDNGPLVGYCEYSGSGVGVSQGEDLS